MLGIDPGSLISLLEVLAKLLKSIRTGRNGKLENALKGIVNALNETQIYVGRLHRGDPRNADQEAVLSRLWANASLPLKNIDAEVAQKCFLKSQYWAEPEQWGSGDVESAKIGIEEISGLIKEFLGNDPSRKRLRK